MISSGFLFFVDKSMVDITHYEVYADRGAGWKLEGRFSADQHDQAIKFAREKEHDNISVKLIREKFDVLDNSYQETVEYISLSNKKYKKNTSLKNINLFDGVPISPSVNTVYTAVESTDNSSGTILKALGKLVLIIIFSLVFANLVVNLSLPILSPFLPEESSQTLLFLFFFGLFLVVSTPLILKKIPWQVFGFRRRVRHKRIPERKVFNKAESIMRLYNLNDEYSKELQPTFPEAAFEDKRYIIEFLSTLIANLDNQSLLSDDFNRLGLKLLVFGGSMELARCRRLSMGEANSLIYEAFRIIDGNDTDLSSFYEAKRSYKDNKVAVFLTGVGAHLMSQLLRQENIDGYILRLTFDRWSRLNQIEYPLKNISSDQSTLILDKEPEPAPSSSKDNKAFLICLLNISLRVLYNGDSRSATTYETEINKSMHNILNNLISKYSGSDIKDGSKFMSIQFTNVNNAVIFAEEFLKDASTYTEELADENLIVAEKVNIIEGKLSDLETSEDRALDFLSHTYDGEILVDAKVYEAVKDKGYRFEALGFKKMVHSGSSEALYKLKDV